MPTDNSDQLRIDVTAAGYAAASYSECPYVSGQKVLGYWQEGFIKRCLELATPPDTPMYILGQIAYLQGAKCSAIPEGEPMAGRWMSSWLKQRDRHPGARIMLRTT